ncbi:MAG: methionyl-tRNA formyltransferase [Planctomycetes bacterium]|nr:methionyl-tRNA formyltransferase [Planctomycetota bacterium]
MQILFAGTAPFAVPILEKLIVSKNHVILGVVTQPDRCQGRGLNIIPSPVKKLISKYHYPVYQPEDINDASFTQTLRKLNPEAVILAAYGQKISNTLLNIPPYGWINIHPSLLPKYRGAAPVAHAVLNSETLTGVTIMKMVSKMDAGPIMAQQSLMVKPEETTAELEQRLAGLGGELLLNTLAKLEKGEIETKSQFEEGVTLAPCMTKKEGLINWAQSAFKVYNHIRAMQPWPGAYTFYQRPGHKSIQVNLIRASLGLKESFNEPPGTIIAATKARLLVNTSDGAIHIEELKPAGKNAMSASDFINGYRVKKGDFFGNH